MYQADVLGFNGLSDLGFCFFDFLQPIPLDGPQSLKPEQLNLFWS